MKNSILFAFIIAILMACKIMHKPSDHGGNANNNMLSSWKKNEVVNRNEFSINRVVKFVNRITNKNNDAFVPIKDRIAVFDMDGTLACEKPFSMELFFTSKIALDSNLICGDNAKNVQDAVKQVWGGYLPGTMTSDSIVSLTTHKTNTIQNHCIPKGKPLTRVLSGQFYKPMMELIQYLQVHDFKVYIVSGSSQQFIWGIVKNVPTLHALSPSHIMGSLQKYDKIDHVNGGGPEFYLSRTSFLANVSSGKAINIYNRIGQKPILAFGNTVDDFDMFSITSSNKKYQTLCVLLNHDSDQLEEKYNAFNTGSNVCRNWNQELYCEQKWNDSIFNKIMVDQKWYIANMSKCFKSDSVFIK